MGKEKGALAPHEWSRHGHCPDGNLGAGMKDGDADLEAARRYLSSGEDKLYSLIPQYLPEYEGVYFSPDGKIAAGRSFFEEKMPVWRDLICNRWRYCERRNDPDLQDSVTLVASIGDLIAVSYGAIPGLVIGALLVKKSLNVLCQCE